MSATVSASVAISAGVRGLVLQPGEFTPHVNGKGQRVRLTAEFIRRVYPKLKAAVAAGKVGMRLSHPGLGDLPLNYGTAAGIGIRAQTGEVYLTESRPLPEMERVLTPEARERLLGMGLSVYGNFQFRPVDDALEPVDADITFIDIVDEGAFTGKSILTAIPADVAARLAHMQVTGQPRSGEADRTRPTENQEHPRMPTLESVEQIAEDVRAQLTPDQQAAYLTAYNQAIEAGATPEAAHATALSTATATAAAEDTSNMEPDKEKDKTTAAAKNAAAAAVAAKDAELQTLRAQLAAAKHNENTVSAKLGSLEAEVKTLAAEAASARQEKERLLAEQDVDRAILAGRVAVVARNDWVAARLKLGGEQFGKLVGTIKATAPVGERGTTHVAAKDAAGTRAEDLLQRYGPARVVEMGLHETTPGLANLLVRDHPTEPAVARVAARLATLAAKKTGGEN